MNEAQRMIIGPEKYFEIVIVSLSEKSERTNSGSKLVVLSRIIDISALAICDKNKDITIEILKEIGTGINYIKKNEFNKLLKVKDTLSRRVVKGNITKLYIVKENERQIFLGGCDSLLQ